MLAFIVGVVVGYLFCKNQEYVALTLQRLIDSIKR